MKRHEMASLVSGSQPFAQGTPDFSLLSVVNRAIAPENPDDIRVAVAFAEKLSIDPCVLWSKNSGTISVGLPYLIAPRWQHPDCQPEIVCLADNPIHVHKIRFVRCCRIFVDQRQIPVGVWFANSLKLGKHDRLADGKALRRALL